MHPDLERSSARAIDDHFSVGGQIDVEQVEAVATSGFKTIICNRPDDESADQPAHSEIEAEAARHGLVFVHMPVVSGAMTMDDVNAMHLALSEVPQPIFAYCRSGARSTQLYQLATGAPRA